MVLEPKSHLDDVGFVPRHHSRSRADLPPLLLIIKQLLTPSLCVKEIDTKNRSIPLKTATASDPLFDQSSNEFAATKQQLLFPITVSLTLGMPVREEVTMMPLNNIIGLAENVW